MCKFMDFLLCYSIYYSIAYLTILVVLFKGKLPPQQNVYVAVKTCAMYHTERLDVIRKTWTKYAEHIGFFTDTLGT